MNKEDRKKRNKHIIELAISGMSFVKISKIYNMRPNSVNNICINAGYSRKKINQIRYKPVVDKYNKMLKQSTCFYDVTKQIRKDGYKVLTLQNNGFNYSLPNFTGKRNNEIAEAYMNGMTASEIANADFCGINSMASVFRALKKVNVKKYPKIKRNSKSTLQESSKLMKRIIYLREKRKFSFSKITEIIKEEGYLSITGREILEPQVFYKYYKYNKLYRKTKPKRFRALKKNRK